MLSVSVIIPVYQSSHTIRETLQSVFSQTTPVSEVIVVDDGSTDGLEEVINPYKGRIIFVKQKNSGAAAARNNGIRHSTGELIAFLDADDIWFPEKMAKQIPLFENPKVGLVFGNVYFLHEGKMQKRTYFDLYKPFRGNVFQPLFVQDYIPLLSVIVRRQLLDQAGFFDESIRFVEDYDLLLRIALESEFDYIQEPVAAYRISSSQISQNHIQAATSLLDLKKRVYKSHAKDLQELDQELLDRGLYNKYFRLALFYMRAGDIRSAKQTLDEYFQTRGISPAYLVFRCVLVLPKPLMRYLIRFWDKIYQKPEIGFY